MIEALRNVLPLFKGRDAKLIEVLFNQWEKITEKQEDRIEKLEATNRELLERMKKLEKLEEDCLQRNVDANDLVRNLVEFIIFDEGRPEKKRDLIMLLKESKNK